MSEAYIASTNVLSNAELSWLAKWLNGLTVLVFILLLKSFIEPALILYFGDKCRIIKELTKGAYYENRSTIFGARPRQTSRERG